MSRVANWYLTGLDTYIHVGSVHYQRYLYPPYTPLNLSALTFFNRYLGGGSDSWRGARLDVGLSTGKYVFGVRFAASYTAYDHCILGMIASGGTVNGFHEATKGGLGLHLVDTNVYAGDYGGTTSAFGAIAGASDTFLMAVDFDNSKVYFARDAGSTGTATWFNSADPAAGTGFVSSINTAGLGGATFYPALETYEQSTSTHFGPRALLHDWELSGYLPSGFSAWAGGAGTLSLTIKDSSEVAVANLTSLNWSFFNDTLDNIVTGSLDPSADGTNASTNGSGVFSVSTIKGPGVSTSSTGMLFIDDGTNRAFGEVTLDGSAQTLHWGGAAAETLSGSVGSGTLALVLRDSLGTAQANLTGLRWIYYHDTPANVVTDKPQPNATGSGATTDGSGNFSVTTITGPGVSAGTGYIVITDSDGNPASPQNAGAIAVTLT